MQVYLIALIVFVLFGFFVLGMLTFIFYTAACITMRVFRRRGIKKYERRLCKAEKKLQLRKCDNCQHHHTMNCPNSSKCYSLPDKPYFLLKWR